MDLYYDGEEVEVASVDFVPGGSEAGSEKASLIQCRGFVPHVSLGNRII
jgi:hypothetical protein